MVFVLQLERYSIVSNNHEEYLLNPHSKTYQVTPVSFEGLDAFIDGILIYHFFDDSPVRLNPEGQFELIFQLDGSFKQHSINSTDWESRPTSFIGGLHNSSYTVKPEKEGAKLISVVFKPHCARFFIPDKLNLFKNKLVDMDDVFPKTELEKIERLYNNSNKSDSLSLIKGFLKSVYKSRPASSIDIALGLIYQRNGFINVDELSGSSFLSKSQFRKRFNEEVGMSPKEYCKIIRTRSATHYLLHNPEKQLTKLTYELGYFDQSHFIKDFKSVMGLSPKHFQNTA